MARRTARQIAAAKRNIVKAQIASARSRKGKGRSKKSGHHYGTGRKGRKATKRALYGSRRHGISPTQQMRRKQRFRKTKRAGRALGGAAVGLALGYASLSPAQKKNVRGNVRYQASLARTIPKAYRMTRGVGATRKNAARATAGAYFSRARKR